MARIRISRAMPRALVVVAAIVGALALAGNAIAATPTTKVSQDPYTNTSSFHQTQVEPDTFSFGSTIVAAFQTGRFYDGGSSNLGWATSTDNGVTWSHGFLPSTTIYATPPGPWARISDPSVAYDRADARQRRNRKGRRGQPLHGRRAHLAGPRHRQDGHRLLVLRQDLDHV